MSHFKVGEECILQSKCHPVLNGDCVINSVQGPSMRRTMYPDGRIVSKVGFAYSISTENPSGRLWAEVALRKKHKPSTESLSSMIAKLNVKSKVESK
jgi:hypothetical protein